MTVMTIYRYLMLLTSTVSPRFGARQMSAARLGRPVLKAPQRRDGLVRCAPPAT